MKKNKKKNKYDKKEILKFFLECLGVTLIWTYVFYYIVYLHPESVIAFMRYFIEEKISGLNFICLFLPIIFIIVILIRLSFGVLKFENKNKKC